MTISVIPERILQNAIVSGFRQFRSNPKLLAILFQNLTDPEFKKVVSFVTQVPINFNINYPRKELTPPSIVLLMKSENESETFLGDFMGYGSPPEEHLSYHSSVITTPQGLPEKVVGPISILSATNSSIGFDDEGYTEWFTQREERLEDLRLYVVAGTGKGRVYNISKASASSIDIEGVFSVVLDTTSRVDIRLNTTSLSIGEPARVFDPDALLYRKGANYAASYQVDVVAGNPEEVIYLYSILKAIFYLNKGQLEDQGLQGLEITGSDLAPRSEYIPDEVFTRTMTLKFHYPFSVFQEEQVYSQIDLALCDGTSLGTVILGE